MGAGVALHADRFLIDAVELALGNVAVIAAKLLLGTQLHAVVGELALASLTVLAGPVFAFVDGTLGAAPYILAHAAVDLVFRLVALCHRVLISCRCARIAPSSVPALPKPTGLTLSEGKPRVAKRRANLPRGARGARYLGRMAPQVKPLSLRRGEGLPRPVSGCAAVDGGRRNASPLRTLCMAA